MPSSVGESEETWMVIRGSIMAFPCRTVNFLFGGCKNLGKNVELYLPIQYYFICMQKASLS